MALMHCQQAVAGKNVSGYAGADACVGVGAYASLVVNKA